MTNADEARRRIRETMAWAAEQFGRELPKDTDPVLEAKIYSVVESQGLGSAPTAVDEYWRLAGHPGEFKLIGGVMRSVNKGLWAEFGRSGGFSVDGSLTSRGLAIEIALDAGSDWQLFRLYRPVLTFKDREGMEVYWVEFDPDHPNHDPPVWTLSERGGSEPKRISDRFSEYIANLVESEVAFRAQEAM